MGQGNVVTEFTYSNQRITMEGYHADDKIFAQIVTEQTFYENKLLEKAQSLKFFAKNSQRTKEIRYCLFPKTN